MRREGNQIPPSSVYAPMDAPTLALGAPRGARPPEARSAVPVPPRLAAASLTGPDPTVVALDLEATDDGSAFSGFYRTHWQGIARGLALTLGDPDLAAEATDEAMARAYPRWATLQHYDNPAGWVYRVGLNWARSYHRRASRLLPFGPRAVTDLDTVADPAIRSALLDLDVKQRAVVVCRLLLDWSVDETASALEISPGTVKSRLHRALQNLERSLGHLR